MKEKVKAISDADIHAALANQQKLLENKQVARAMQLLQAGLAGAEETRPPSSSPSSSSLSPADATSAEQFLCRYVVKKSRKQAYLPQLGSCVEQTDVQISLENGTPVCSCRTLAFEEKVPPAAVAWFAELKRESEVAGNLCVIGGYPEFCLEVFQREAKSRSQQQSKSRVFE